MTIFVLYIRIFVSEIMFIKRYKIIAFTHKTTKIDGLKDYIVEDDLDGQFPGKKLNSLKDHLGMDELFYMNTCNRVLFFFTTEYSIDTLFLKNFFSFLNPAFQPDLLDLHVSKAIVFEGQAAISHFFGVAASLDSLVVGEREILGQIKAAYSKSKRLGLCQDAIRIAVEQAIVFAKRTYTKTRIGEKPVSVVSLAHKELLSLAPHTWLKIVLLGAGQTNNLMATMLHESGFRNLKIYNRTVDKATEIAKRLDLEYGSWEDFDALNNDFDVLIACVGVNNAFLDNDWATKQVKLDKQRKYIFIDLAVPSNFTKDWQSQYNIKFIDVDALKTLAEKNMVFRKNELLKAQVLLFEFLEEFNLLLKERALELALTQVPEKVRAVRKRAEENVFKGEIEELDESAQVLVKKMMDYFEKKYIAIPIKLVKKSILKIDTKKF